MGMVLLFIAFLNYIVFYGRKTGITSTKSFGVE